MGAIFAAGLFTSQPVRLAILAGGLVALVSGAIGVFVVLRGQSFAGHALSDLGTLGGSGAFLAGVNPLVGYLGVGVAVAALMDLFGAQRSRSRDVATGIVLGASLGGSALLLYFDTTTTSTTGVTVTILFGSLFTVTGTVVLTMVVFALAGLLVIAVLYRPLLLSSVNAELAAARGVRVRALGLVFLMVTGMAAALASVAVGTILAPALLIGPAATALRLSRRPATAILLAGVIGAVATWIGIVLAYDSYHWPPQGHGWPVSSFVVAIILGLYLLSGLATRHRTRHAPHQARHLEPVRS